jgi:itaconate CoA-transferase
MPGPLDGMLVVALEQAVAAPLCTLRLAEAGARVIKIERAEGDFARHYDGVVHGESAYFVWLNRGKESVVLDIKTPADARLLDEIIARSDVFVQNLAPGAAARAGFGSAALRQRHAKLITCDISGFGDDGPLAHRKAYDLLIQCESGLASITGTPEAPGRVGISIADIACGVSAHAAILEALILRQSTGHGSGIAVSLFDAIAEWMSVPLLQAAYGTAPGRVGLAHSTIVPYGAFSTADDREIVIAIQNEREWAQFCQVVLGDAAIAADPRFVTNQARVLHREACNAVVAARCREVSLSALVVLLTEARTAFASVNSVADLRQHPHLRQAEVGTPTGPVRVVEPPARWTDRPHAGAAVPALGEHGSRIRQEFA